MTQQMLSFDIFHAANLARCQKWHPNGLNSWSSSDWMTALVGEVGELASLLKMRNRERDGLPGNKFSPTQKQIADELADVFTYLDLLAAAMEVDLGRAAIEKFNEVSVRVGFPDRINLVEPHDPLPDCDCQACAIAERDRLRVELTSLQAAEAGAQSAAGHLGTLVDELRSQQRVLAGWIRQALNALPDVDADAEDGGQAWRDLIESGEKLVAAVLAPAAYPAPDGPECNLKTPWAAP